jgi:hypothetical protein
MGSAVEGMTRVGEVMEDSTGAAKIENERWCLEQ